MNLTECNKACMARWYYGYAGKLKSGSYESLWDATVFVKFWFNFFYFMGVHQSALRYILELGHSIHNFLQFSLNSFFNTVQVILYS